MIDSRYVNVMSFSDVVEKHRKRVQSEENRRKISDGMKRKISKGEFFTPEHRQHLSDAMKGNHNFGTGDTRSIPCYCLDNDVRRDFKNYKEAGIWWYNTYKPFGDKYSQATYQRKIISCIDNGYCYFKKKKYDFRTQGLYWFRNGGDAE